MNVTHFHKTPELSLSILNFGIQWTAFVFAAWWKTEKFYDLTGSLTFLTIIYISYQWSHKFFRQSFHSACITIWAFRLGLFLFVRILKSGEDRRFRNVRDKPGLFFVTWTLQGVWVIVTLLPTWKLMSSQVDYPFIDRDYIGYSLWIFGFLTEVIADYQKAVFRNDPKNKGKFISSGLWFYSRHPNYFGEIVLWFGLYLSASSVLHGWETLTILCPIFGMLLITKISGIPPLEEYGLLKWGQDANYREYLQKTSVLVPFLR